MGNNLTLQPAAMGLGSPNVWNSLHPLPNVGVPGSKIHTVCPQYLGHPGLKFILQIATEHHQWIFCSLFGQPIPVLELAVRV